MINFKITDISTGLITVVKPAGKPIPLNVGEIVKGEVVDVLATGGVTLKIKGSFITARTDIPVQRDSQIMLKVLGTTSSPNELRLQLLGPAEGEAAAVPASGADALNRFAREFTNLNADTLSAEKITNLLKALPVDINSIPKDLRLQLQNILQEGLKSAGSDIQSRLEALFRDLPPSVTNTAVVQGLKLDVAGSVEILISNGLKGLLRDTGVALEAKLKAAAELVQQSPKDAGEAFKTVSARLSGSQDISQMLSAPVKASIENDLKTNLLRLRDNLISQSETVSQKEMAALKVATGAIDSILRDIDSYQLMSKTTGSFYTFLPVSWQELKDGEASFRSNSGDEKTATSSCRLNLDLEQFGKLSIMVLMHGNEFFVSFRPDNQDFKTLLDTQAGKLDEQFRGSGLFLKAVRVLDKDDKSLERMDTADALRQIVSIKA
jgi:hypothetical protein